MSKRSMMNKDAYLLNEKENVSSNRASEGKTAAGGGGGMRDTLESYRRTKNMLKDLSKNLRPNKGSTQRAAKSSTGHPIEATSSLTRRIQRDIAEVERTISNDGGLVNTTEER
jgi:hypothetical protein